MKETSHDRERITPPEFIVHGSEHPDMVIVSQPLNGSNFVSWQKSMLIALGDKSKIGFIDGSLNVPPRNSPDYILWKKADCLVVGWILSSISKDLYNTFVHAKSAKMLWDDICERFGAVNGTKFFQLQKRIYTLKQGHDSISVFYGKLKEVWDELDDFDCIVGCTCSNCTCDLENQLCVKENRVRLTQLLMELNEYYEQTMNQIMIMEPLPTLNRSYSIVARVEQQRQIQSNGVNMDSLKIQDNMQSAL